MYVLMPYELITLLISSVVPFTSRMPTVVLSADPPGPELDAPCFDGLGFNALLNAHVG